MKKLALGLAGAVLAVAITTAGIAIAKQGDTLGYGYPITDLDAVAMNGAAGTRTFTIDNVDGYATIQFWFDFDYTSNAGELSLTCTGGPSSSDNDYTLTTCDSGSTEGECSAKTAGILKSEGSLSADTKWDGRLGIRGAGSVSCVAAQSGSPGATELFTVKHQLITQ